MEYFLLCFYAYSPFVIKLDRSTVDDQGCSWCGWRWSLEAHHLQLFKNFLHRDLSENSSEEISGKIFLIKFESLKLFLSPVWRTTLSGIDLVSLIITPAVVNFSFSKRSNFLPFLLWSGEYGWFSWVQRGMSQNLWRRSGFLGRGSSFVRDTLNMKTALDGGTRWWSGWCGHLLLLWVCVGSRADLRCCRNG